MLMSESVSACPCFIATSWWMAGLISDGCELSWGARQARQARHGLKTIATSCHQPPPACSDPDTARRVARVSGHPHQAEQEKLNFSSLINDLSVPGGRSLLNVWARSIYIEMRNVFTVFLFIFCERLVIPMLFLLYSLLILPIWVPALCSSCCALMWCLIFLQYSPLSFQILVWRCLKLGQFSRT